MNKQLLSTTGLLLAAALFLAVNIAAGTGLRFVRMDLTENGLYTLSDGTRNILRDLEEPVTLRYFASEKLLAEIPQLASYSQRVKELLEEYQVASRGKLTLEVIEPEPFSEEEDRAVSFGLKSAQINTAGDRIYFGLAGTNSVDDEKTIPFFDNRREEFLEYDITELVYNLANLEKKVVGVLSTLPLQGMMTDPRQMPQPWVIMQQIEQIFETRMLEATVTEIPDDVDVLMVVHPKDLSDETLFAIDQFVLGGGNLLAFVDAFCESDMDAAASQNPMMANRTSQFDRLLGAWGLTLTPSKIAGDRLSAERVNARNGSIEFPLWLRLQEEALSDEDFVTGDLGTLTFRTAGILESTGNATTTVESLVSTSTESMGVDTFRMQFQPDPEAILNDFIAGGKALDLVVRVSGTAETAFPDGKPSGATNGEEETDESAEEAEAEGPWLTASEQPINVIVVSDADMLQDSVWARVQNFLGTVMIYPVADNGDFVINALDNLCGSNDLISLRSRGQFQRPFDKKAELEREADDRFREEEQLLEAELRETERMINELQQDDSATAGVLILTEEQQAQILEFRDKQDETRKKLREVKHQLREDIESLGSRLKFANIGLVPLLIIVGGIAVVFARSRRR